MKTTSCNNLLHYAAAFRAVWAVALSALLAVAPSQARGAEYGQYDFTVDGVCYIITGNSTAKVASEFECAAAHRNLSGTIAIPASVRGNGKTYAVTQLGTDAFNSCTGITSVTLPNTITAISDDAFSYCGNLAEVVIPDGVTAIGNKSFAYCSKLTAVRLPKTLKKIGRGAFSYCSGLVSVEFPESLVSLGEGAFSNCGCLTALNLPASLTVIPATAFTGCKQVESVSLHDGLRVIGQNAFNGCAALTALAVPASVDTIGNAAFANCTALADIRLPDKDIFIEGSTFAGTAWYARQPDGLIYLGTTAYAHKGAVPAGSAVVIREGVTRIARNCFSNCHWLESVTLPKSLVSLGDYAFKGCAALTTLDIPDGVTQLGQETFADCSGLLSVKLPSGITSLPRGLFRGCTGLVDASIPASVTTIGVSAFMDCSSLRAIALPGGLQELLAYAFNGCSLLERVALPASVSAVGEGIFGRCVSLVSCELPQSMSEIGSAMFAGCVKLASVTIPARVRDIGSNAFSNCASLTEITLPTTINTLKQGALFGCSGLRKIQCPASRVPIAEEGYVVYHMGGNDTIPGAFDGVDKTLCTLEVPEEVIARYRTSDGWKAFKQIGAMDITQVVGDVNGDGIVDIADLSGIINDVLSRGDATVEAGDTQMSFVFVQGGTFDMGADFGDTDYGFYYTAHPGPKHTVTVGDYLISTTEVTKDFYAAVMDTSCPYNDFEPQSGMSWTTAQAFIDKLNRTTGLKFRLPTEAEWEYAARGGNRSRGYTYSGSNEMSACAWAYYLDEFSGEPNAPHGVARLKPNELGLYDMSGNVWEWCEDWFGDYPAEAQVNPQGPVTGTQRVLRGGSCNSLTPEYCAVVNRAALEPDKNQMNTATATHPEPIGLRLVLDPGQAFFNPACDVNRDDTVDIADINSVINVMLDK